MTQEEKQLLLKDLCGRLPYGVKVTDGLHTVTLKVRTDTAPATLAQFIQSENLRYYLRPMSSMTAEEEYEYHQCKNINYLDICEMEHEEILETTALCFSRATDWLNKNGFDYRGLIPMGLALEAKEGMYF